MLFCPVKWIRKSRKFVLENCYRSLIPPLYSSFRWIKWKMLQQPMKNKQRSKRKIPKSWFPRRKDIFTSPFGFVFPPMNRFRSSLQRQLSIDMLRHGYHHSFRELCAILAWQKEDRERLGAEHPLHRRPLLDAEPEKLRFLCQYLNKAEEAERRCIPPSHRKSHWIGFVFSLRSIFHHVSKLSRVSLVFLEKWWSLVIGFVLWKMSIRRSNLPATWSTVSRWSSSQCWLSLRTTR